MLEDPKPILELRSKARILHQNHLFKQSNRFLQTTPTQSPGPIIVVEVDEEDEFDPFPFVLIPIVALGLAAVVLCVIGYCCCCRQRESDDGEKVYLTEVQEAPMSTRQYPPPPLVERQQFSDEEQPRSMPYSSSVQETQVDRNAPPLLDTLYEEDDEVVTRGTAQTPDESVEGTEGNENEILETKAAVVANLFAADEEQDQEEDHHELYGEGAEPSSGIAEPSGGAEEETDEEVVVLKSENEIEEMTEDVEEKLDQQGPDGSAGKTEQIPVGAHGASEEQPKEKKKAGWFAFFRRGRKEKSKDTEQASQQAPIVAAEPQGDRIAGELSEVEPDEEARSADLQAQNDEEEGDAIDQDGFGVENQEVPHNMESDISGLEKSEENTANVFGIATAEDGNGDVINPEVSEEDGPEAMEASESSTLNEAEVDHSASYHDGDLWAILEKEEDDNDAERGPENVATTGEDEESLSRQELEIVFEADLEAKKGEDAEESPHEPNQLPSSGEGTTPSEEDRATTENDKSIESTAADAEETKVEPEKGGETDVGSSEQINPVENKDTSTENINPEPQSKGEAEILPSAEGVAEEAEKPEIVQSPTIDISLVSDKASASDQGPGPAPDGKRPRKKNSSLADRWMQLAKVDPEKANKGFQNPVEAWQKQVASKRSTSAPPRSTFRFLAIEQTTGTKPSVEEKTQERDGDAVSEAPKDQDSLSNQGPESSDDKNVVETTGAKGSVADRWKNSSGSASKSPGSSVNQGANSQLENWRRKATSRSRSGSAPVPRPGSSQFDGPGGDSSSRFDGPGASSSRFDGPGGDSSSRFDGPGASSSRFDGPGSSSSRFDGPGASSSRFDGSGGDSSSRFDGPGASSSRFDGPGPSSSRFDGPGNDLDNDSTKGSDDDENAGRRSGLTSGAHAKLSDKYLSAAKEGNTEKREKKPDQLENWRRQASEEKLVKTKGYFSDSSDDSDDSDET